MVKQHAARIYGSGDKTIVFAHGFGSNQTAWRHQVEALRGQHRVIVFDQAGAGSCGRRVFDRTRHTSLAAFADDLEALLDELAVSEVTLVGHSMGAMIGVLASLRPSSRIGRLVLIGASPRYLDDVDYRGGLSRAEIGDVYAHMRANYEAWVHGFAGVAAGNPDKPQVAAEFAQTLLALRPDIAAATATIILESDYRSVLRQCPVPALVVQAREDAFVPSEVGLYLAKALPLAAIEMIDATGHFPHLSAPEVVSRLVASFVAR